MTVGIITNYANMISSKIRKQIYIEPRQEHLLKAMSTTGYAYAQQADVSEAEIIRQAISY